MWPMDHNVDSLIVAARMTNFSVAAERKISSLQPDFGASIHKLPCAREPQLRARGRRLQPAGYFSSWDCDFRRSAGCCSGRDESPNLGVNLHITLGIWSRANGRRLSLRAGGKSGLHRAGCWITSSLGDEQESATESRPPRRRRGKGETVR